MGQLINTGEIKVKSSLSDVTKKAIQEARSEAEQLVDDMSTKAQRELSVNAVIFTKIIPATETQVAIEEYINLQNNKHGESNKVVCAKKHLNHHHIISALHQLGWVDDILDDGGRVIERNALTEKGLKEMNKIDENARNISKSTDILVLQNFPNGLYWRKDSPNFNSAWAKILEIKKDGGYNDGMKSEKSPFSEQTLRLIRKMNKTKPFSIEE